MRIAVAPKDGGSQRGWRLSTRPEDFVGSKGRLGATPPPLEFSTSAYKKALVASVRQGPTTEVPRLPHPPGGIWLGVCLEQLVNRRAANPHLARDGCRAVTRGA